MPPTDASADAGPVPAHPGCADPREDSENCEDTLDLRLPDEFVALMAGKAPDTYDTYDAHGHGGDTEGRLVPADDGRDLADPWPDEADRRRDTPDRRPDAGDQCQGAGDQWQGAGDRWPDAGDLWHVPTAQVQVPAGDRPVAAHEDLLDGVRAWGPIATPVGPFQLHPVRLDRDLPLIRRWMNDPAVAAFWELAGSGAQTEDHLRAQLTGDGRSVPCVGILDGTPMSYWEIYRADLDPLARYYPSRPHDTGVHLLIGGVADRGRGLGSALLRAVADLVLDRRPACVRVVAEPDLRNTASVAAFLKAGFRYAEEVDLPAKRAALMIRDRSLRHLM
ncbi:GNAT family N-acetyltransferase [Streptomyces sp. NPDC054794]